MGDLEKRVKPVVIKVSEKHLEKYVAFADFNNKKIIAYGKDPGKVIEEARKKGYQEPVLMYIRDPRKTYIYSAA